MADGFSSILDLTQITQGSRRLRSPAHITPHTAQGTQDVLEGYTQKVSMLGVTVTLARQLPLASLCTVSFAVLLDGTSHPVKIVAAVSSSVCSGLSFIIALRSTEMDAASEAVLRKFCT